MLSVERGSSIILSTTSGFGSAAARRLSRVECVRGRRLKLSASEEEEHEHGRRLLPGAATSSAVAAGSAEEHRFPLWLQQHHVFKRDRIWSLRSCKQGLE